MHIGKFKQSVSWAYHSEDEDAIRNELGYDGNMEQVYAVVKLLAKLGADYDTVDEWSKSD
jgi:hypothetical protein